MIECRLYTSESFAQWNECVKNSKSPLFFFQRDFMEYHSDRFEDGSLMFLDDEKLIAVMPASRSEEKLVSHGGLTFGGLLYGPKVRSATVIEIFEVLKQYCRSVGVSQVVYKSIPHIFHTSPAQEDLYAITRNDGSLLKRELSSAIDLSNRPKLSKGRKWLVAKAKKEEVEIERSENWSNFYELLSCVLKKHGASPVHSVDELEYLSGKFPKNIELNIAKKGGEIVAATLLFKFSGVTHTQYMAVSDSGKDVGALDLLIETCIQEAKSNGDRFFSFGISTEDGGAVLNEGLVSQKESFGARAVTLDTYAVNI